MVSKSVYFFQQVAPGDSLWVVVSGGPEHPGEWKLLQRIVIRERRHENPKEYARPYQVIGDSQLSERYDINAQTDITDFLHKLAFVSGKRIAASGKAIGLSLQAIRPLSQPGIKLFEQYSKNLKRLWSDVGLAESTIERVIRKGARFGSPEIIGR